jgi:hypothetical protein
LLSHKYFSGEKFSDHASPKSIFLLKNLFVIPRLDSLRSCVRVPSRTHAFAPSVFQSDTHQIEPSPNSPSSSVFELCPTQFNPDNFLITKNFWDDIKYSHKLGVPSLFVIPSLIKSFPSVCHPRVITGLNLGWDPSSKTETDESSRGREIFQQKNTCDPGAIFQTGFLPEFILVNTGAGTTDGKWLIGNGISLRPTSGTQDLDPRSTEDNNTGILNSSLR